MGRASEWEVLASKLVAPTLGIDLPGHGSSPVLLEEGPWFAATCLLLEKTLIALEIPIVDIVGYSLGGRVASHFAKRFPSKVRKIVLESSHPGLTDPTQRAARLESDKKWADQIEKDWPHVLDRWYEQPVFESLRRHPGLQLARNRKNDPFKLARAIEGFSLGHQSSHWHLDHPALFMTGAWDQKYRAIGTEWSQVSPQIQLFIVECAGHNIHLEQPEAYLAAIARFLELDLS